MATMHDVLDAQWMYDNYKDGEKCYMKSFYAVETIRNIINADLQLIVLGDLPNKTNSDFK